MLHDFAEAVERLLAAGLLVLLGGAVHGGILGPIGVTGVVVAVLTVLVVRPVAGWLSLLRFHRPRGERAAIAFFGIRGVGSAYYLAYALNHATFEQAEELWAITALIVLLSVGLHGVATGPTMARLDERSQET